MASCLAGRATLSWPHEALPAVCSRWCLQALQIPNQTTALNPVTAGWRRHRRLCTCSVRFSHGNQTLGCSEPAHWATALVKTNAGEDRQIGINRPILLPPSLLIQRIATHGTLDRGRLMLVDFLVSSCSGSARNATAVVYYSEAHVL